MEKGPKLNYIEEAKENNSEVTWNRQLSSEYLKKFVMGHYAAFENLPDDDLNFDQDIEQAA